MGALRSKSIYIYTTAILQVNNLIIKSFSRLRARDFYAVIVDEGEARINYHCIEIE